MKPDFTYEVVESLPPKVSTLQTVLENIMKTSPNKWCKFKTQTASNIKTVIRKFDDLKNWEVCSRTTPKASGGYDDTNAYVIYMGPSESR